MLKLFFDLFSDRHAIGVTLCERIESCNVGFAKTSSDVAAAAEMSPPVTVPMPGRNLSSVPTSARPPTVAIELVVSPLTIVLKDTSDTEKPHIAEIAASIVI